MASSYITHHETDSVAYPVPLRLDRRDAPRSYRLSNISDEPIRGLSFSRDTEANAVFGVLDNAAADRIRERVRFYDWDRAAGEVRWMTAFDTTEADVDNFVVAITEELAR